MPGPPRIVVVSPYAPPHVGGVERTTAFIARELGALGCDVRIITCAGTGSDGAVHWPVARGDAAPLGVPLARPSLRGWREASRLIRTADVVIQQNLFYPLTAYTTMIAARTGVRQRTIVHANASLTHDAPRWAELVESAHRRTLARWQLRHAPAIAVSPSSRKFVADHYAAEAAFWPLPLARELPSMSPHPQPPDGSLRLVFAGRLVPLKGVDVAVAAAAEARRRGIDARLSIYGDGPGIATCRPGMAAGWIDWHGERPWAEVVAAVRRAHGMLATSRIDNAQTAVLEALALGVPVIATRVGEAPEYLAGPLARLLVDVDDVSAAASRIIELDADWPRLRKATQARGGELRMRHAPDRCANRMMALLGLDDAQTTRRTTSIF